MQKQHRVMTGDRRPPPYSDLGPERILDAVENAGWPCDGHLLALNSYENRVYQVGIEAGPALVVKFYRPGRWSNAAILEEHRLALELAAREIPVVAPLRVGGQTLLEHGGFRFAVYPRRGGRWPELADSEDRLRIGRFMGRIHAVGAIRPFRHRPALDIESFGVEPSNYLLRHHCLPDYLETAYATLIEDLLLRIRTRFAEVAQPRSLRLHGDCHRGNILWTDAGPHFVDLDDCRMGPAIQDLWMLLDGNRAEMSLQLSEIVEGYEQFYDLDRRELHLIEALRTLRMIHYAAWLARRWDDPAFPLAFPWFGTHRYWEEHILALREQAALLDEPPLAI
jgi:Ser/Thr protein kinase RdoA (MazF antagonist)